MALGLALTDNADGTGATATITGATPGRTVTLYAQKWSGGMTAADWAEAGSRIGDGTVSLPLGTGYHWVYASDGVDSLSAVKAVRATDGADPLHWQCLQAVQATIQALALDGIASGNVVIRLLPWRSLPCPGIVITPIREPRTPADNARDLVSWSVQVSTVAEKSNQDTEADAAFRAQLDWRQRIANAFSQQPLAGVAEAYSCTVETGPVVIPAAFGQNYDIGALVLRFDTQVVRGVT